MAGTGAGASTSAAAAAATAPESLCCDICGNTFARKSNLLKHKRSVHAATRKHVCVVCGFAFKRYDHLTKHFNSTHLRRKAYACSICPSAFAEKFNRDKHVRLHWQPRPFQCPCGAYFQRREVMEGCLRCKARAAGALAQPGLDVMAD
jgi:uncharacterized Zn-finger protein